jgi:hypothetical protein
MSADRANQRGWGQTGRCPTLLAKRRSSPRQQHDRNSTTATKRATDHDELHGARVERESEGARLGAQLSRGE